MSEVEEHIQALIAAHPELDAEVMRDAYWAAVEPAAEDPLTYWESTQRAHDIVLSHMGSQTPEELVARGLAEKVVTKAGEDGVQLELGVFIELLELGQGSLLVDGEMEVEMPTRVFTDLLNALAGLMAVRTGDGESELLRIVRYRTSLQAAQDWSDSHPLTRMPGS